MSDRSHMAPQSRVFYSPQYLLCPSMSVPRVFLAGPTLRDGRDGKLTPWREEALRLFPQEITLFVPEPEPPKQWEWDFVMQVEWEEHHLVLADCIMFWIPRDMRTMPGLTTNVEWGYWGRSGKVVLGAPPEAEHMGYIRYYAKKFGVPQARTLEETIALAADMATKKRKGIQ